MEDAVTCPHCRSHLVRHRSVVVYQRAYEDGPGRRTALDASSVRVENVERGFAGRRDDIRIEVSCERCKATSWLYLIEHRGQLITRWGDANAPEWL